MITKGNQRAGGQQLATHLLNEFDNECIEIAEVRGTVAQDLHGAFAEWKSVSLGTRCQKFLYSLSVNPWVDTYGDLTREQYLEFIARTEKKLGLVNQPRAIVFHVKEGREHCHIVWSRIDVDKMKAVQLSHDRQKLRAVVREFAKDHNLELPEGLKKDNRKDRFDEKNKEASLAEKQQQERTGLSKADHKASITAIWSNSDSARAFYHGLETAGYYLCRGNKRSYVVLDRYGEIHSLARMIDLKGVNTKEVRKFLGKSFPEEKLRSVEQAQKMIDIKKSTKAAQLKEDFRTSTDKLAHDLAQLQLQRRDNLNKKITTMKERHKKELAALKSFHQSKISKNFINRILQQDSNITATLLRVTGLHKILQFANIKLIEQIKRSQKEDILKLKRRHKAEILDFKRKGRGLDKVFKRENRSLRTTLRRLEREASRKKSEKSKDEQALKTKRQKKLEDVFKSIANKNHDHGKTK